MLKKWLWLAILVTLLDQLTKWWISHELQWSESIAVLPFFDLTLLHNTGAAFSLLSEAGGWQRWLLMLIAMGVAIFLILWLYRLPKHNTWLAVAIVLILGGAVGNLYDRIHWGYVIDFLDFYYDRYHFPPFNLADSAITIGTVMLMIELVRNPHNRG